jgi:hypothetical protein
LPPETVSGAGECEAEGRGERGEKGERERGGASCMSKSNSPLPIPQIYIV